MHEYVSTACQHNSHDRCRKECKFCQSQCRCSCHGEINFKVKNLGTNMPHDWDKFQPGEAVRKISGYEFDSVVVSVFLNTAGATRLVCESTVIPGMLHIFNPQQMEHRNV